MNESIEQLLERRNRERTYLVLFVHDRSLSMQTGKHWMLPEDELVRHYRNWHEEGALGQNADIRPEDVIVAAFVNLRLIGSEATDTFYNRTTAFENELDKYNMKLDEWLLFWGDQMRRCKRHSIANLVLHLIPFTASLAHPFHSAFLEFFQSHVRLFLNTFGLNLSILEVRGCKLDVTILLISFVQASRAMPNSQAVRQCHQSARRNLHIVSQDFAGMHVLVSSSVYGRIS